jgi:glycine betaine/proline transport system ATP-binding protein
VLGVHDCTLTVAEGEILVLMGLSGSGKSTLLRGVNALNPVVRGEVRVLTATAWCRSPRPPAMPCAACAPPESPWCSSSSAFALAHSARKRRPWAGTGGQSARDTRAAVDAQLKLVNLAQWAERKVGELSGGMQQRVGLARAFVTEAPILLMDEPFSALDPLIRAKLQDELLDLQAKLKRTIVFVSHDLDEAFKIGNRIALMEGGRIVQCGTAREIIANPVSDYVADFVAHMNPLGVLTARDVMQPGLAPKAARACRRNPGERMMEALRHGAAASCRSPRPGADRHHPIGRCPGQASEPARRLKNSCPWGPRIFVENSGKSSS